MIGGSKLKRQLREFQHFKRSFMDSEWTCTTCILHMNVHTNTPRDSLSKMFQSHAPWWCLSHYHSPCSVSSNLNACNHPLPCCLSLSSLTHHGLDGSTAQLPQSYSQFYPPILHPTADPILLFSILQPILPSCPYSYILNPTASPTEILQPYVNPRIPNNPNPSHVHISVPVHIPVPVHFLVHFHAQKAGAAAGAKDA